MGDCHSTSVAVIIPCFDQARFLGEAITTALAQTVQPQEIIVVDDGSADDVRSVTSLYPDVKLIRQANRGLAGARNTGLRAAGSDKVLFLDSDDRLHPDAIASGLACFCENQDAAFVYGAYRRVEGSDCRAIYSPVTTHRELVSCNWIGMCAAVIFDRQKLLDAGGFDESLGMVEDWDAYLRLSRQWRFATHPNIVADYVRHSDNVSNDVAKLWDWIEIVRQKEKARGLDPGDELAWREGLGVWVRMLGPDPRKRNMIDRLARGAARWLGRPVQG